MAVWVVKAQHAMTQLYDITCITHVAKFGKKRKKKHTKNKRSQEKTSQEAK